VTPAGMARAAVAAGFLAGLILVLAGCPLAACFAAPVLAAAGAYASLRWGAFIRRRLAAMLRRTSTEGAVDRA
jgi:hypothetical protein